MDDEADEASGARRFRLRLGTASGVGTALREEDAAWRLLESLVVYTLDE